MRFTISVAVTFLFLYLLNLALLAGPNRPWWHCAWIRGLARWTPAGGLVCGMLWGAGHHLRLSWVTGLGAGGLSIIAVYLIALILAQVVVGPIHLGEMMYDAVRRLGSRLTGAARPTSPGRRRVLRLGLTAVPALTGATATLGIAGSASSVRLPRVPLVYADLPAALCGLTILHLTDSHVGTYHQLPDLECLLERASTTCPDLVVITGDVCDDLPSYRQTLALIEQVRPPLGIFGCLGNHEYYRGIDAVLGAFERSTIPLLVDRGVSVPVGNTRVYISGADDPRSMRGGGTQQRLRRSVERCQAAAPTDAFSILLSHRAAAFDYAASLGVDLTLAGHSHGSQLGIGGRSLLETRYPDSYMWGHYRKQESQLYTSAGIGHWFPFRLGCPPEAPVYILQQASPEDSTGGITPLGDA